MGEVEGLKGAMRGKVPDAGVGKGDGGEVDPESEEPESDSEPERRRPSPIGMGREWVKFFSSEDIVGKYGITGQQERNARRIGSVRVGEKRLGRGEETWAYIGGGPSSDPMDPDCLFGDSKHPRHSPPFSMFSSIVRAPLVLVSLRLRTVEVLRPASQPPHRACPLRNHSH